MTPEFNAWAELAKISALGATLMAGWWRKGSEAEDNIVSQAAEELIRGACDADFAGKIEDGSGINPRDHVTVEELEDWAKDRDLRGWRWRN